ncbi:hypothetical protein Y887_10460 [Xanthomonas pisi DSM 18956]|nr:hypothetical protein Y887_10460 [Xanthomonas pisi DSM 18956]
MIRHLHKAIDIFYDSVEKFVTVPKESTNFSTAINTARLQQMQELQRKQRRQAPLNGDFVEVLKASPACGKDARNHVNPTSRQTYPGIRTNDRYSKYMALAFAQKIVDHSNDVGRLRQDTNLSSTT